MSGLVTSLSRRAFAAAVLASAVVAAMPAFAATAEPLVSPQWLSEHRADSDIVVLDIRSVIDGGGAEAYAKAHGLDYVVTEPQSRAANIRPRGYGENFATDRREPWSH